jgi:hypothetical protein
MKKPHEMVQCFHEGETSTYCTRCWMNLYEARRASKGVAPPGWMPVWKQRGRSTEEFGEIKQEAEVEAKRLEEIRKRVETQRQPGRVDDAAERIQSGAPRASSDQAMLSEPRKRPW